MPGAFWPSHGIAHKLFWGACTVLLALALVLVALQVSLEQVAFSPGFYHQQFDALAAEDRTGMSREDLDEAARRTRGFLAGERADLYLLVDVHGEEQPLYTPRELVHLEDVRELIQMGRRAALTAGAAALGLVALGARGSSSPWWRGAGGMAWRSSLLALLVLGASGLVMSLDFEAWFLWFHEIAFDNDFWMLNPDRHLMIRMFPQPFFQAAAQAIAVRTVGGLALVAVASWGLERLARKRTQEVEQK